MLTSAGANAYRSPSTTKISNPRLLGFVRLGVYCFFIFWIGFGLLSLPSNWQFAYQNTTQGVKSFNDLARLGISVELSVFYSWFLLILADLVALLAAIMVFRYRGDDWLGITVTILFISFGIPRGFGNDIFLSLDVILGIIALLSAYLLFHLFPYPGRRKYLPPYLWILYSSVSTLTVYLGFFGLRNDFETQVFNVGFLIIIVHWFLSILSLRHQYIESKNAKARWQIKLLIIGIATMVSVELTYVISMFFPSFGTEGLAQLILYPMAGFASKLIFFGLLLIAILPPEAWQFKLFANQSLIYIYLFMILLLIFAGLVFALQFLLQSLLGLEQSTIAAMVSVAAIASIFNPLHRRLQSWINRQIFGINLKLEKLPEKGTATKQILSAISNERPAALEQNLSAYILHDSIGSGGMGKIFRATQKSLKRPVAIKVMLREASAESQARFEREARIMAHLRHPNIVKVFDFGMVEDIQYIVMEYIEGESLGQHLAKSKVLNIEEFFPFLLALADALDYAHSQGVVHRDIKPSNIMLRPQANKQKKFEPILLDFGLGKFLDSNSAISEALPMGTLAYMAPEQIRVADELDHRLDIYALGVICYQLFTGELPFPFSNPASLLFAQLYKPAPDPRLINPNLDAQLAAAVLRALEKSPARRPQTALAFIREFVPLSESVG